MTLEEIKASDKIMLVPTDIAKVVGSSAYNITLQARENPDKLGFNVCVVGTRTLIPRLPFIQFCTQLRTTEERRRSTDGW